MDFYYDEQLPKIVAQALNVLESHEGIHHVYSTDSEFGKGIKDLELFEKLKSVKGVLITPDLKMKTRQNEFSLLKRSGVTVFMISLPTGSNFELQYQTLIGKWAKIKKILYDYGSAPFVCKIKLKGKPEFL